MNSKASNGLEKAEFDVLKAEATEAFRKCLESFSSSFGTVSMGGETYVPIRPLEDEEDEDTQLAIRMGDPEFVQGVMDDSYDWPSEVTGDDTFGWVPCYTLTWDGKKSGTTPGYATADLMYNVFTDEIEFF